MDALCLLFQAQYQRFHDISALGQLATEHNLPQAAAIGAMTLTTVTATSIVFEIIGPICAKFALQRAGEIPKGN